MRKKQDMPVYLFTGFLEAGKTRFIQETLEDKRFCNGEKTLLLLCEEGEEEYAPDEFASKTVQIRTLENQSELTPDRLTALAEETDAERVVIEYNGMWLLDVLYTALPEGWMVYQEFFFADYEYPDGKVEYDEIVDPLPFDLDAPIVEIGDDDYATWYRDLSEEPKKYEGKTVRFKCRALVRQKLPSETFVAGRHVMTCCVEDIQFAGLVCQWKDAKTIRDDTWMILTAKINFKFNRAYGKRGPVLTYLSAEPCEAPEQPVATFY